MNKGSNVVAGINGGKRVICAPSALNKFIALKNCARQGNHWARIALGQLQGLCTGRIGKDNIYVKPNENRRPGAQGCDEFFIILPGCRATIERKPDDSYHIIALEVDESFTELQLDRSKPGMYFANKVDSQWRCDFKPHGSIDTKENTLAIVAISNSGYKSPEEAAIAVSPELKKYLGSGAGSFFESDGFNLHHTPGTKKLGGLRNWKDAISPLDNIKTLESAQLLAKAMYDARNTKRVRWVSQFGGSAVLTQAMQMLANQGIKLDQHTAYMIRPTTDTDAATRAALSLGLQLDRQLSNSNPLDYIGNRNRWKAISTRRELDKNNYTLAQASWDRFCHLKTLHGAVTGVLGTAVAAGVAVSSPVSFLPAAVAPTVLTMGKVLGWTAAGVVTFDKAAAAFIPQAHNKITGKFK